MSDTTDVDVLDPDGGVELAHGGSEVVSTADGHVVDVFDSHHPGPRQYVIVAFALVILTAIEVWASYLDKTVHSNILIAILSSMAAAKFFLVCAWYMHMKQDKPLFRRMFITGMVGAAVVYGVVFLSFASTVLQD